MDDGMTVSAVNDLWIDPDGHVLAATWGGCVFRAAWDGASWTQHCSGLTDSFLLALDGIGSGQVWTGTYDEGVFVSNDHGLTWAQASTGLPFNEVSSLLVVSADHVFVGGEGGGVYETLDGAGCRSPAAA